MTRAEFRMTRRVTFAETDLAGVMHFANYYRWMEEVEHAFWRSRGMCVIQEHGGLVYSWPRVITSCEYFAPAHFEDEIEMHLTVTDISEKSLTYEVTFSKGHQKIARGRTKAVCCTMKDGAFASTPIPEFIRGKLAQPPA
jgi:YbgC/YbaW family acyl-CoA thioester hydrolase